MVAYVSPKRTDGTVHGLDATAKIGFYGVTPVVQPASATQAAITAGATATATTALVIEIRTALVALGLMKGGAA